MSDKTGIEWTDATWNPVTGCTEVSPGCDHCYAKTFAERWRGTQGHYFVNGFDVQLRPDKLLLPLRWRKPRRIFVNSMSDLFHDEIPRDYIGEIFDVMAKATQHTFQILTKRHARMRSVVSRIFDDGDFGIIPPLENVWLGVSAENQKWADIRIPALLDTPAFIRFVSIEPLLGPIDLSELLARDAFERGIDWVIVGGESGPGARMTSPDWVRDIRDQCQTACVPFLFKQWGAWAPINEKDTMQRVGKRQRGRELDGRTWNQYPQTVTHA